MSAKDRVKQRLFKELAELRKKGENKYCAECGDKQPTWTSTNLGVFICIRCSGIHRKMGTHISFVKYIDIVKYFCCVNNRK